MTTYCAPCIADLALVREAATSVAGTAACMAHAVLLTHGTDDPGRRRQRLDALKDLAQGKAENADPVEQARLELLVQEYGLAGAMDMGGPARRGPSLQRVQQRQAAASGAVGEEARRPKSRRGRPRPGDRPEGGEEGAREGGRRGARGEHRGETLPVTTAPGESTGPASDSTPPATAPAAPAAAPAAPAAAPAPEPAAAPVAPSSDTPAVPPSSSPDA